MPPSVRAIASHLAMACAVLIMPSPSSGTPASPPPQPTILHKEEPAYPKAARKAGETGMVVVRVLVDSTGSVVQTDIDRRKDQPPKPLLEAAAIAAALKCKFEPARENGRAIATWIALPFRFIPEITVGLAADTEFAVGDTISATITVTSNARIDSLTVEVASPMDPYGAPARIVASMTRQSWILSLLPGRPVTRRARFAATSCGSSSVRVRCLTQDPTIDVIERSLPVCVRGPLGNHLPEYSLPAAGDTTRRALRVDSRVFAQRADTCCYAPDSAPTGNGR